MCFGVSIIVLFGIIGVGCSYGLRFLAVQAFFEHALDEVLELVALPASVDFEPPVKVGGDLESRRWDWWWRSCDHGVTVKISRP